MAGDLITCPSCQGWTPAETGWVCTLCEGEGVIWDEYPDDDYDDVHDGYDAGEWNNVPAPHTTSASRTKED